MPRTPPEGLSAICTTPTMTSSSSNRYNACLGLRALVFTNLTSLPLILRTFCQPMRCNLDDKKEIIRNTIVLHHARVAAQAIVKVVQHHQGLHFTLPSFAASITSQVSLFSFCLGASSILISRLSKNFDHGVAHTSAIYPMSHRKSTSSVVVEFPLCSGDTVRT